MVLKSPFSSFFFQGGDDMLRYQGCLYFPNVDNLREKPIVLYISFTWEPPRCIMSCGRSIGEILWRKILQYLLLRVLIVNKQMLSIKKLGGLSQDINIPTWKLEDLNMDFIVGLPCTWWHYPICVIIDRMTKSVHFILIKVSHSAEDYAKLYLVEMVSFMEFLCPYFPIVAPN